MIPQPLFHPAVAGWFAKSFAAPTAAQEEAWPAIKNGRPVLIAAPTGSGKTLAAFLAAIDGLVRQGIDNGGALPDETQIVYVSPLKALSNDIQKNLERPLAGIREELAARGRPDVAIRTWVRTGDTPAGERDRMRRLPPHILVTTPESLYILIGSESGRRMLAPAHTVIVDEIHAVAGNKRGAHLALTLARLDALCGRRLQRIGLSATQKPIGLVADFLVGAGAGDCAIIDTGHRRRRDLALELPSSPLEAVMSGDVWREVYDRLAELAREHRTTLIFVNTRRMAERATRELSTRLGEDQVAAHHGSLAKERRLDAEQRLKAGALRALVATASLELGIDIGEVDLVCQLGSPRSIAAFLQRVGRSGHAVDGTPKGRLFPASRDELVECAALLDSVRRGELDRLCIPERPLDVLAQHIVAETAAQEWREDALFDLCRRAWPYRELPREDFAAIVAMLADGFSTRRGRRGALVHHDAVNGMLRGRRGARITALTSGGTIPDNADYQVVLEPENQIIGSVNEDFAVESLAGDVFQLGNTAYRIRRVERGTVRVEDAQGQPPNIPFWLGEAPGRSDELSASVSRLRSEMEARLEPSGSAAILAAAADAARMAAVREKEPREKPAMAGLSAAVSRRRSEMEAGSAGILAAAADAARMAAVREKEPREKPVVAGLSAAVSRRRSEMEAGSAGILAAAADAARMAAVREKEPREKPVMAGLSASVSRRRSEMEAGSAGILPAAANAARMAAVREKEPREKPVVAGLSASVSRRRSEMEAGSAGILPAAANAARMAAVREKEPREKPAMAGLSASVSRRRSEMEAGSAGILPAAANAARMAAVREKEPREKPVVAGLSASVSRRRSEMEAGSAGILPAAANAARMAAVREKEPRKKPVMAGLDPAIHEDSEDKDLDARIKSGHDEKNGLGENGLLAWLSADIGLGEAAARQIVDYLAAAYAALGALPTREKVVFERFFDAVGGMQLVIHSPYGSRLNRAWGLALRKRFCTKFNFELQAAATEDNIVLSLTTAHSFDLAEVKDYLHPDTVRDLLVQAVLDAPMFMTRWRWVAGVALALPRFRGGKKVPPPLARMDAEDLIAAIFPDQLACAENLVGAREVPDHPLVRQTLADCLGEAMDIAGLAQLLAKIRAGEVAVVARDLTEPSPLALEVLAARPYAYLDDAPLEERRTQAVIGRRWLAPEEAAEIGKLDIDAIERVKSEAWPAAQNRDELHDGLAWLGFLTAAEAAAGLGWGEFLAELANEKRATRVQTAFPAKAGTRADARKAAGVDPDLRRDGAGWAIWVAAERLPQFLALWPQVRLDPPIAAPGPAGRTWAPEEALVEIVRSRLEGLGPITEAALAAPLGLAPGDIAGALAALQAEGFALRGRFTPGVTADEWCERRLLARIHRYTVRRLRAEIEPVAARDFLRFLFDWQRVADKSRMEGPDALAAVLGQLEGFEAPAGAWETEILPARVAEYDPAWLDDHCRAGRIAWSRLRPRAPRPDGERNPGSGISPVRSTPITLLARRHAPLWAALSPMPDTAQASAKAQAVMGFIRDNGASFFDELVDGTRLLRPQVEAALAELVALGLVNCDSFAGLRALLLPADRQRKARRRALFGMEDAGRWVLARRPRPDLSSLSPSGEEGRARRAGDLAGEAVEHLARTLLRRYGVVFWRLLEREAAWLPPWRDLLRVYRRLEARGEIRGGRFVAGFAGEQYALPEAIGALREARRKPASGELVSLSGADPLNLVGILTPGARLAALTPNRILYRDGLPVAVLAGGAVQFVETPDAETEWQMRKALLRGAAPPSLVALA